MNSKCGHCEVEFEPEPGFYQGAMFVSYALSVIYIGVVCLLVFLLGFTQGWVFITSCISVLVLLIPFTFRFSRIIYLYLFGGIKFDVVQ
jgi:hypothetical protein